MEAELPTREIIQWANEKLGQKSLPPVSRRTIDYWISVGLIEHPRRKGKAGGGLFPDWVRQHVVCIRELQERYNFTLADIREALANGSSLGDVLGFMDEVANTYGSSMLPEARAYAATHRLGENSRDEAANFYVATRIAEGDEELEPEGVADLVGLDVTAVMDLSRSRELPCHGREPRLRFLRSEISEWKGKTETPAPTEFTELMSHLMQLNNDLGSIHQLGDLSEKSHEWLAYWIDAVDNELWRLRRLSHEEQMKRKAHL